MSRKGLVLVVLAALGMAASSLACGGSSPQGAAPAVTATPAPTPIVKTGVAPVDGAVQDLTEAVADGNICDLGQGALYCITHPLGHMCPLDAATRVVALENCTPVEGEETLHQTALNEARAEAEAAK